MKNSRTILIIFSFLLLTLTSGLFFYKNLFFLDSPKYQGQLDLDEMTLLDQKLVHFMTFSKKNINPDFSLVENDKQRLKDLINLLSDFEKDYPNLHQSIIAIADYHNSRLRDFNQYQDSIIQLKQALNSLNSYFLDLQKNKITYLVDKQDVYKESFRDVLLFITYGEVYESKVREDLKILSQILVFSKKPNKTAEKFLKSIESTLNKSQLLDQIIKNNSKPSVISDNITKINAYIANSRAESSKNSENFLNAIFSAIIFYLVVIIFYLFKRQS